MNWKNFFYVFGLSCKSLESGKGLRGNILASWSLTVNVILLIIVAAISVLENIFPSAWDDHFLRHLVLQSFGLVSFFDLLSVQLNAGYEGQFWKLHECSIKNFCKYKPTCSFKFKVYLEILNLVLNLLRAVFVICVFRLDEALQKIRFIHFHITHKLYLMKLCFFMDVLAFQLDELNRLVLANKAKESAKQLKHCWKMKQMIHKIFEWPLMFNCGLLIIGAINTVHLLYNKKLGFNAYVVGVAFAYIEVLIVGFTCQIIETKLITVKKSIFARSRSSNEMLIVQLHHQNMELSPLQICRINNQCIVSV